MTTPFALLACDWGRKIWTADDGAWCDTQAARRIALHDKDGLPRIFQLCDPHAEVVLRETDPHGADTATAAS